MTPPRRVRLADYGTPRAPDYVRVFVDIDAAGVARVRAQYRDPKTGKRKTEPFGADTKKARADAKRFGETLSVKLRERGADGAPARLTVGELGEKYLAATLPNLRANTRENYTAQWTAFADFVGPATRADLVRLTHLDDLRTHYRAKGWAHKTVREVIATAKRAFKWAEGRELIPRNRLYAYVYHVAKDERTASPDEYSPEEFAKLLAAFDPTHGDHWRAWVVLTICGAQGVRQHAALHLQWADVDLADGTITWRAAWDKNGVEWVQPLRVATRAALDVARAQAEARGLASPWVVPSRHAKNAGETYSAQSLWLALKKAETRAGVARKARRGAHGLRRLLAGEVWAATGDAMLALHAIGDKDPKMADRYLKRRESRVRDAFDKLDAKPEAGA